jgi:hypothetical protein
MTTKSNINKDSIINHINNNKMSTSAIIRYVASHFEGSFQEVNNQTYNFIKKNLPNVTTKNGGEIRYQHVRGVMITPIGTK